MSNTEIARMLGVHYNTISTFANKYLPAGLEYEMSDVSSLGKSNSIPDEEEPES